MNKLSQLKRWLTLPDAAQYLSRAFGEPVSPADVLRLALDGHLTLSVHFVNHVNAQAGAVVALADAKRRVVPNLEGDGYFTFLEGAAIPGEQVIELEEKVWTLTGVWDLTMFGAEELDVENLYQTLTNGPAVELQSLDGVFVTNGAGVFCKLMNRFTGDEFAGDFEFATPYDHPNNYFPAGALPDDSVFVVRVNALQDLVTRVSVAEKAPEKPLQTRERNTLTVVIAALARMARVDVSKPSAAAAAIENETSLMGARVAARTIENHLKLIPDAIEAKMT